jgi:glutamyl-tRNA synthetase
MTETGPTGSGVRTRIAPSPTGPCHLGTARTALFNYLFAKGRGGTFIFRLEDTDRERSTREFEQELYEELHWLGLHWDEGPDVGGAHGPYRQSERADRHRAAVAGLLETGHAYRCFCTAEALEAERQRQLKNKELVHYGGACRNLSPDEIEANLAAGVPFAVRFKMPDETFTFNDLIRGEVTVEGAVIGDFVIAKPIPPAAGRSSCSAPSEIGDPIFHLSNVVDDAEMAITHVIRGEDHLPNVPKHIALFRALGHEPPVYAHLPLILNPDGSKMSKRKTIEGLEPYVRVFREKGYLPEALVNYLALLGWSPGDDREQLTLSQLTEVFSLENVTKSGARFDMKKLDDLNGQYIRAMSPEAFAEELCRWLPGRDPQKVKRTAPLIQERLTRLSDAAAYTRFFFEEVEYDRNLLKVKGHTLDGAATMISEVLKWLPTTPDEEFAADALDPRVRATAEQEPHKWKASKLFMVIRVALTGSTATPPLFETMELLGKQTCVHRLRAALEKLRQT